MKIVPHPPLKNFHLAMPYFVRHRNSRPKKSPFRADRPAVSEPAHTASRPSIARPRKVFRGSRGRFSKKAPWRISLARISEENQWQRATAVSPRTIALSQTPVFQWRALHATGTAGTLQRHVPRRQTGEERTHPHREQAEHRSAVKSFSGARGRFSKKAPWRISHTRFSEEDQTSCLSRAFSASSFRWTPNPGPSGNRSSPFSIVNPSATSSPMR